MGSGCPAAAATTAAGTRRPDCFPRTRTGQVSQRDTERLSSEVSQRDTGMINGNSGSVPKRTACLSQINASECERRWAVVDACPLVTMSSMRGGESISTENDCFPLLVGFVRFEPEERKVRGKVVREIRLRPFAGSEDELVWLWPEFAHVP